MVDSRKRLARLLPPVLECVILGDEKKTTIRRVFEVASADRYSHTGGHFLFAAIADNLQG